ncbi:MAG: hypothetical protein IKU84_04540 [Clostridia bacterium]|nr:hypothetical protein [Clostridia bacterium]
MDCTYFRTLGSAIIDGEASDVEIKEFNDHITTCQDCAKWFETLKILKTADLTSNAPDVLKERVIASVKNENKKPSFFSRFRFTAVAAAVAIIVFAANGFMSSAPEEISPQTGENSPAVGSRMVPPPDQITVGNYTQTPENIYDRAFSYVIYVKDTNVENLLKDVDFEEKNGYKYYITNTKYEEFSSFNQEIIALNLSLDAEGLVIVNAAK